MRGIRQRRPAVPDECIVMEHASSLHDHMRQMLETQVVVAMRFHNLVCALNVGKPVISIGYSDKNQAIMAEMGLGEFYQPADSLDVRLLISHFEKILLDYDELTRIIAEAAVGYRARVKEQEMILNHTLLPGQASKT